MTADPPRPQRGAAQTEAASLSMVKIRRARRSSGTSGVAGDAPPPPAAEAAKPAKAPAPIAALPPPAPVSLLPPPTPANRAPQAAPPKREGPPAPPPAMSSPPISPAPRPAVAVPPPLPLPKPHAVPQSAAPHAPVSAPVIALAPKAAAPTPAKQIDPVRPTPQPPAAGHMLRPHDNAELVAYWNELRGGKALPPFALLDRERVSASWPDSLTVSYAESDAAMPYIKRLSKPTGEIEYSPMVTDWILSCAREVARRGQAMEDLQEFPSSAGLADYHLLLLPFATPQSRSTHVVCHLSRQSRERAARG